MKVYYPGPDQATYHPRLGRLVKDEPFELPGKVADLYIKAGLLKKATALKKK